VTKLTDIPHASVDQSFAHEREWILRVMAAASFLVFFQAYLFAPLIPSLMKEFHASEGFVGLLVPAYMLPYGFSVLFYGPLSDRIGRRRVLIVLLALMVATTAGMATSRSAGQLMAWRILAGAATGGVAPIALALFGDLFEFKERGRAIGWIFGAIAGGMAFGSTMGALLNPFLGWRLVLVITAALEVVVLLVAFQHQRLLEGHRGEHPPGLAAIAKGYLALYSSWRGRRTYAYILLNGMFHSGIFSWLGVYFHRRYGLSDVGIGLALLGYGVPGMLLGPTIGHLADRIGRRRIIPLGFIVAGTAGLLFVPIIPLWCAVLAATLLSLGFDMSHPLLAGIITSLDPKRRGQAMGMNAFILFMGFGLGALVFQLGMQLPGGLSAALLLFGSIQVIAGFIAIRVFQTEHAQRQEEKV
jgi:predicted MFS family arabinose efflux permease